MQKSYSEEQSMYQCTRCKAPSIATPNIQMILARHGETDLNRQGICVGSIDVPLNAEGERQARVIASALNGRKIDAIQSSPLIRARRTAEIVGAELGLSGNRKIIVDARLRERHAGILQGKQVRDGIMHELLNYSRTPPEGEPLEFFEKRIAEFLKTYYDEFSGMNCLIVTHSHVILGVLKIAYGWTNKDLIGYGLPAHSQLWEFAIRKVCWNCGGYFYEKTATL